MALRLRDIVNVNAPPPAPRIEVPPEAARPSPAFLRGIVTRAPETSYALYAALLAAAQQCMDQAQRHQPVTLGGVPTLVEQLVQRVCRGDAELLGMSMSGGRAFSLAGHGLNVAILSVHVGRQHGLYEPQLIELGTAALLHDIGMVRVASLMQTPARLERSQRQPINDHPRWSHHVLSGVDGFPAGALPAIAQEHERFDGSGYPHRLKGRAIHPYAQLIGLLDVYESLIHVRPHRPRLDPSDATRLLVRDSRRAFDPALLRAFLQALLPFATRHSSLVTRHS